MLTADFDYDLPPSFIAQHPLPERDASRLLVLDRAARTLSDRVIRELPALLRRGDLLVFNDTRVVPARLHATRRRSGGRVEIFLLPLQPDEDPAAHGGGRTVRRVLTRSGGRLSPGERFGLPEGLEAELLERHGEAGDLVAFDAPPEALVAYLERHGEIPLPPYIRREPGPSRDEDRARYQTLLARAPGAVAAPTAGLHFSQELLAHLEAVGIERAAVTLHVGPGTFRSVKAERIEDHFVDPEPFVVGAEAARAVTQAKSEGRRVIPIGTTALRVLESRWDASRGELRAGAGLADLFVRPPFDFRVADALLTNFHLPKSSLLMLAAAFAAPGRSDGIAWVKQAYEHAQAQGYRFFSYGDACLFV